VLFRSTPTWQVTPTEFAASQLAYQPPSQVGSPQAQEPAAAPLATAPAGRRPRRVVRGLAIGVLIVFGIAGVGGGGTLLVRELTRKATSTEIKAAVEQEIATRWQRLPASQIFPATVRFLSEENNNQSAHLVGIAPSASCQSALDSAVVGALRNLGCAAVLRATYTDDSGALVATVGAAVLASPKAASTATARLSALSLKGIKPLTFSGTVANFFRPATIGFPVAAGPYVFFYAAGYSDGEPSRSLARNPDLDALGQGLVSEIEKTLTSPGKPCTMKDIRC